LIIVFDLTMLDALAIRLEEFEYPTIVV